MDKDADDSPLTDSSADNRVGFENNKASSDKQVSLTDADRLVGGWVVTSRLQKDSPGGIDKTENDLDRHLVTRPALPDHTRAQDASTQEYLAGLRYGHPLRRNHLGQKEELPTFEGPISEMSIWQGPAGSCGPVGAIKESAYHKPNTIYNGIRDNPNGNIDVLLNRVVNKDGIWIPQEQQIMEVTREFPVHQDNPNETCVFHPKWTTMLYPSALYKAIAGMDQSWDDARHQLDSELAERHRRIHSDWVGGRRGFDRLYGTTLFEDSEMLAQITGRPTGVFNFWSKPEREHLIADFIGKSLKQDNPIIVSTSFLSSEKQDENEHNRIEHEKFVNP